MHHRRLRLMIATIGAIVAALTSGVGAGAMAADAWAKAAEPGHFVVMRHAEAPGTGDPPSLVLGDCSTQRNLDDRGRAQARRIGAAAAKAGVQFTRVLSSAWCRCIETAQLMTGRAPEILPSLNSFFGRREAEADQMARLKQDIAALPVDQPALLVTHQVVVTALTGVHPASGEALVVKRNGDGTLSVAARIKPP
ncbi:MAG: histidine phosphatase family protein [Hyphomicrobiaceae bacterium]